MTDLVEPVAIIGMAGRFPEASNLKEFWDNLREGRECVRARSDEELLAAGVKQESLNNPHYVKANSQAPGFDLFDAEFFGMTPHEAKLCDPQFRVFLETCHAAVENAGYDPVRLDSVGIYGSIGRGTPPIRQDDPHIPPNVLAGVLTFPDYVSILASYKLNFTGPSLTVLSACSSSLLAIQLAVQALRVGDCELALAGGVEGDYPPDHGYWWTPGGPHSRDGHCRPFDAAASGTVFGTGVGVVLLKPLSAAVADGDDVRAIIRGIVANNDGADKMAFSAPSVSGQSAAMMEAIGISEIAPQDISYVEAHATGTPLGDPIEVAALTQAFRRLSAGAELPIGYCGIGSVKGNVGHLAHASGITSLIKVALALENEELPASINITEPNPKLEIASSPFYLHDQLRPWPRVPGRPRRAGVNSLGFGGTNVHAILEEGPVRVSPPGPEREQVVLWSAMTEAAVAAYEPKLAEYLSRHGDSGFADLAGTLQDGRTAHPVRAAMVCRDAGTAIKALDGPGREIIRSQPGATARKVAFLFPGQGSQHARMAQQLYAADRNFRHSFDECLNLMGSEGSKLRHIWQDAVDDGELENTLVAQQLLFAVEYALAQMWHKYGVRPAAVIGHSVGELVAAAVSGVIALPDAVRLVTARAKAMAAAPAGAMLAVSAGPAETPAPSDPDVVLAAVNGPQQVVFSGPADKISEFTKVLADQKIPCQHVRTSHAFHHPLMEPAASAFAEAFSDITLSPPALPFYSAASGGMLTDDLAVQPSFWASQIAQPVLFGQAMDRLLDDDQWLLLEVGPERALTSLLQTHPAVTSGRHAVLASQPRRRRASDDGWKAVLEAAARLWVEGHAIDWAQVRQGVPVHRLALPGYQYQRSRHWFDVPEKARAAEEPGPAATGPAATGPAATGPAATGVAAGRADRDAAGASGDDLAGPFATATWIERRRPRAGAAVGAGLSALALLPRDPDASSRLIRALQRAGLRIIPVWPADEYQDEDSAFYVRSTHLGDMERVFESLARRGDEIPELLVHAWSAEDWEQATTETVDGQLDMSLGALIGLFQSSRRLPEGRRPQKLLVLTSQTADVSGGEPLSAVKATLTALIRSLIVEDPRMRCRLVDIGPAVPDDELVDEIRLTAEQGIVALRGDRRWVPAERPLDLDQIPGTGLRRDGVYLITGGLGGLGMEIAKALTRTGLSPRLALVGRTVPAEGAADARAARIGRQLREMRALGAEVRTFAADVADARSMRRVLDTVSATFGPVNGVLHLAGITGGGILQLCSYEDAKEVLRPKVYGTLVLEEVFSGRPPLDFFVSFASRSSLDGDAGGAAYAAANAFLDAHAHTSQITRGRILSIDWCAWNTVGMVAAEMVAASTAQSPRSGKRLWTTVLSPANYPILDDHRVAEEESALLPGAAMLDLTLHAFRSEVSPEPDIPARLENVVFREPLFVDEPRQVQVVLEPDGDRWGFTVRSAPEQANADESSAWTVHATGRAADAAGTTLGRADLDAIRQRTTDEEQRPPLRGPGRFIQLGARYDNIQKIAVNPSGAEKLVSIRHPAAFSSDLDEHFLHPALLDAATALARNFGEPLYLPFAYNSLQLNEPLPAAFFSHIRRRTSPDGLIIADIDLITPEGQIVASITGFTMRIISAATFTDGQDATNPVPPIAENSSRRPRQAEAAPAPGLSPRIGGELLLELLRSRTPRQVSVLPHRDNRPVLLPGIPLEWVSENQPARRADPVPDPVPLTPGTAAASVSHAASDEIPGGRESLSDLNAIEDRLKALWSGVLGVTDIAPEYDFFDLGGHSLSAINLMTAIQAEFSVDLEVTVLFEYSTLSSLAEAIRVRLRDQR